MIDHFNIPIGALINVPITKKQFAEKAVLSGVEKRALREDLARITMRGLLQTRTIGIPGYNDSDYNYDQILFAEVDIWHKDKTALIATMLQKAFPAPLFLIFHYEDTYCVNRCVKRINQSDNSRRVIEEEQTTRYFTLKDDEIYVNSWLHSLDIRKITCSSLKELFDELSSKLFMLKVSDETGTFVEANAHNIADYKLVLEQLKENREEQRRLVAEIQAETQFNRTMKLNSKLKDLQMKEKELKEKMQ